MLFDFFVGGDVNIKEYLSGAQQSSEFVVQFFEEFFSDPVFLGDVCDKEDYFFDAVFFCCFQFCGGKGIVKSWSVRVVSGQGFPFF